MARFRYGPPLEPQKPRPRFRYLTQDAEPADVPVCRMMQRAHDLRDRYPGQARLAWRDLIEYLIALPPPKELV